jgi:hypothetical protein
VPCPGFHGVVAVMEAVAVAEMAAAWVVGAESQSRSTPSVPTPERCSVIRRPGLLEDERAVAQGDLGAVSGLSACP